MVRRRLVKDFALKLGAKSEHTAQLSVSNEQRSFNAKAAGYIAAEDFTGNSEKSGRRTALLKNGEELPNSKGQGAR